MIAILSPSCASAPSTPSAPDPPILGAEPTARPLATTTPASTQTTAPAWNPDEAIRVEMTSAPPEIARLFAQSQADYMAGRLDDATRTAEDALAKIEAKQPQSKLFACVSMWVGLLDAAQGRPDRAAAHDERAVNILATLDPPDDDLYAYTASALAFQLMSDGRQDQALVVADRSVAHLQARAAGKITAALVVAQNRRSTLRIARGDDEGAIPDLEAVLAFRRASMPGTEDLVMALHNLARARAKTGDFTAADRLYREAISVAEDLVRASPDPPYLGDLGMALVGHASMLHTLGREERAEALYTQAIAHLSGAGDPYQFRVAIALNDLGLIHLKMGRLREAKEELAAARTIMEKRLGPRDPARLNVDNSIAVLDARAASAGGRSPDAARADAAEAERALTKLLEIHRSSLGPSHPDVALSLSNLAGLARARGDLDSALAKTNEALQISEAAFGHDSGRLTDLYVQLFRIRMARREIELARDALARAIETRNRFFFPALMLGSEYDKRRTCAAIRVEMETAVSLHMSFAPSDPVAARLALSAILFRKARAIDAAADIQARVRSRAGATQDPRFLQLASVNRSLAALWLREMRGGASPPGQAEDLLKRKRDLEDAFSITAAVDGDLVRPIAIDDVRAALPEGAVLVEVTRYQVLPDSPEIGAPYRPARYAAYLLSNKGEPTGIDLGPAAELEKATLDLIAALGTPTGAPDALRRQLYTSLIAPIAAAVPGATTWLVAPDGALSLVPWGALLDPQGSPALEKRSISYLTTGRDLLRFGHDTAAHGRSVLLGDPDYGPPGPGGADRRLPGSRTEVEQIAPLVPGARVLFGREASEAALKQVSRPAILHLATHGLFAGSPATPEIKANAAGMSLEDDVQLPPDDSLVRSFVSLAGANGSGEGGEDGRLTAVEATDLDLEGTQLVVLSACQSAVGTVLPGDGVLGLRRAFFLAGAETQLATLWPIQDEAGQAMMKAYYRRVLSGEGRAEALRSAQSELRATPRFAHPTHWAGFVIIGDPAPLKGLHTAPNAGRLPPSERGCACSISEYSESGAPVLAAAVLLSLFCGRRRKGLGHAARGEGGSDAHPRPRARFAPRVAAPPKSGPLRGPQGGAFY